MRSSFHGLCLAACVAAGCGDAESSAGGGDAAASDAVADAVVTQDASDGGARADAVDAAAPADGARVDDAPIVDAGGADAPNADAASVDAAPVDAAGPIDVGGSVDAGATIDGGASSRADAPDADVTDGGGSTDRGVADVGSATDAGCGALPTLTALAPAPSEEIETCSASNGVVNYVFRASASGDVSGVRFNWRTPGGDLAPPTASASGSSPFAVTRQVGGPTAPGAAPALAVFPNALRGTWTFEVDAVDRCGRAVSARRAFTLTFTTRRCPNP